MLILLFADNNFLVRSLNVAEWRYEAILLRQRFEANRGIKDLRVAKLLLEQGEQELWLGQHPKPVKCKYLFVSF